MRTLTFPSRAGVALTAGALFAVACIGSSSSHQPIAQQELASRLGRADAPLILDVRSVEEYRLGHISSAINIPYQQIGARLNELAASRDRDIVVYCESGPRTETVEARLRQAGFERVYHLDGDMAGWRRSRLPTEAP
ncbi:MAG: rhodanese-like domain-containing protein [Gemmatimonadota bacterium]|nr:rhodanese-like domain-containing protein [Gemmatimonadota bacterium]MDH3367721.1 rhodanese-like domain-containing protein [Gemmatimonadota bacterium]MDH3477522.1 rhodanese-like domain-containing protein [Gemmatimonadota bacterium]MDH3568995.1 rhodanese-like domain-containing protein [Gemmatimonadota bacterium]MDH5549165.1 rhodanese-like domain-containing protein [Gemmatimonadota bacterium]